MSKIIRAQLLSNNDSKITTNANQEITGAILNGHLEDFIDSFHTDEDAYTKAQIDTLFSSGNTLDALEDVNITSVQTGNLLVYNGTDWVNSGFSYENILANDYYFIFSSGNTLVDTGGFYYEPSNDSIYMENGLVIGTTLDPRGLDIKGILDVSLGATFYGEFIVNSTSEASILSPLNLGDYVEFDGTAMIFDSDNNYFEVNVDLIANGAFSATNITGTTGEFVDLTVSNYLYTNQIDGNSNSISMYGGVQVWGSYLEVYGGFYVSDDTEYGIDMTTNAELKITAGGSNTNYIKATAGTLQLEGNGANIQLDGAGYSAFWGAGMSRGIEMSDSDYTYIYDSGEIELRANTDYSLIINGSSHGIEMNSASDTYIQAATDIKLEATAGNIILEAPGGGYIDTKNYMTISAGIQSTSYESGSLIVNGGVGIAGDLYVDQNMYMNGGTKVAADVKPHGLLTNNNTGGTAVTIVNANTWETLSGLSFFTYEGLVMMTGSSDKVQILYDGHYLMTVTATIAGSNGDDIWFRLRNLTQNTTIDGEVGITTTGTANRQSITIIGYYRNVNINDEIALEIKNSSNANDITFYSVNWFIQQTHV